MVQKINHKSTHWGTQWLNLAGRVALIKSILSALPIYQYSALIAPKRIYGLLSKKIREFLWRVGKENQKKFYLVCWNQIINPKNGGGLGIRNHKLMNKAMGPKLLWRLVIGHTAWWKKSGVKKYFEG